MVHWMDFATIHNIHQHPSSVDFGSGSRSFGRPCSEHRLCQTHERQLCSARLGKCQVQPRRWTPNGSQASALQPNNSRLTNHNQESGLFTWKSRHVPSYRPKIQPSRRSLQSGRPKQREGRGLSSMGFPSPRNQSDSKLKEWLKEKRKPQTL